MTGILMRRPYEDTQTDMKGSWSYEDKSRNWSDPATKRNTRTDSNHQELGRGKKHSSLETSEGVWPCKYPGFGLAASITMRE